MIAIYKREVKSFFHSFIGWLFLAATLLLMGIYFTVYNMLCGYPNISYVLQSVIFLFIITIPILTMRILAEERKQKTDQLILTAPITVGKIVLGKYLALVTVFAIPVLVIGLTPLVLSFFGTFQMGVSYTALLGFFLYGCMALAIGMFLSSLTESIVIAAVLTFGALFLGYLMSGLCSIISTTGNFLTQILSVFDMASRFDEMTGGSFSVQTVVYYISCTLFLLFCTVQSIQKRRYSASNGIRIGAYSSGMIAISAVLTVIVNLLVAQLPEGILSLDVTSNKLFTLTEETKEFVPTLTEDVTIYVYANEETKDSNLDKTIQKIKELLDHITVSYVDPSINPKFYTKYTDTAPASNSLIVVGEKRSRVVDYSEIYTYEIDYTTYDYQITGYDGEGQLTSALAYVTTDDMPKIYVITGHDELALETQFTQTIQKENIDYEELSLLSVSEIPEDAQAIIIDAPLNDYSQEDVDKVIAYLEQGGNALIIPTWTDGELTNFQKILDFYGVSVVDGMIVETDSSMIYSDPFYLFPQINYDEITENVINTSVFAPYSQGLSYDEDTEEVYYTPLLESGVDSYSKTDLETATSYDKQEGDIDGPFVIALKAEKTVENDAISNAVIIASENLFTENADSIVPGCNVKLFSGVLTAMTEHESSVSIPVKQYDTSIIAFSSRASYIVGVVSIVLIPLSCLIIGFVIWFNRRKK